MGTRIVQSVLSLTQSQQSPMATSCHSHPIPHDSCHALARRHRATRHIAAQFCAINANQAKLQEKVWHAGGTSKIHRMMQLCAALKGQGSIHQLHAKQPSIPTAHEWFLSSARSGQSGVHAAQPKVQVNPEAYHGSSAPCQCPTPCAVHYAL